MYEIACFDLKGNTIDRFFQWDVDQKIVMELKGCDEEYLSIAPEVHFTNISRSESLIVRSAVSNGETITADVPNILLQEPYPLLIYVYLTDAQDVSSQKTILYSEIPVRKRAKPSDYLYVENIKRITAEDIKDEIEASTESARTQAIQNINNTKDSANKSVTDTKTAAQESITKTKNDAEALVTSKKEDFISTGNSLISSATEIRDNTQTTYNKTVTTANQTQTKIENNINTLIKENGLTMKTTDDGNGNITMTILVNQ